MRPGQNNKRMRGRPTNNRRGPNPLTRSYESNGPDVKIRGNAHHIAEKYLQLARDAHTSGDPVAAENYLQHAEHYFRLIASAQAAQIAAQQGRPPGETDDDEGDDDDGGVLDRFASPPERAPAFPPPQPYGQPQGQYGYNNNDRPPAPPFEGGGERPQNGGDRNNYQPRGDRPQYNNNRQDNRQDNRPPRPQYNDRQDNGQHNGPREYRNGGDNRPPREFRPYREPTPPPEQPQPRLDLPQPELPAFITAAPRPIAPEETLGAPQPSIEPAVVEAAAPVAAPAAEVEPAPRGRRRRVRSPYGFAAGADEAPVAPVTPDDAPTSD
jgi:hypothetical protein